MSKPPKTAPELSHFVELRNRLFRLLFTYIICAAPLVWQSRTLYTYFAQPLLILLPEGQNLIATDIVSPFMVPLKLSLWLSLFMIMPVVFYQIWQFISPGLYPNERKNTAPVIVASIGLFYIGALFAYYIACPLALGFFVGIAPSSVSIMTDIQSYLDFILAMLFAFGLGFQVPIISFTLIRLNILSIDQMREQRPYIIIGAFVLGMILTPPDVISQIMLALPLWALFELGLFFATRQLPSAQKV